MFKSHSIDSTSSARICGHPMSLSTKATLAFGRARSRVRIHDQAQWQMLQSCEHGVYSFFLRKSNDLRWTRDEKICECCVHVVRFSSSFIDEVVPNLYKMRLRIHLSKLVFAVREGSRAFTWICYISAGRAVFTDITHFCKDAVKLRWRIVSGDFMILIPPATPGKSGPLKRVLRRFCQDYFISVQHRKAQPHVRV